MKAIHLIGILAWAAAGLLQQGCTKEERPNFVWIISEDNSKHYMELFDAHGMATPHIQKMAEEGILYQRAFSNAPVCSVARSTLISSCYAPRIGAQYHRKLKEAPMPEGVNMFPAYLRRAGYYTTNKQKEDYNLIKGEGVWDESSRQATWKNREPDQPFFHMESFGVSHESSLHFPEKLMDRYEPVTDPEAVHVFPHHPDTELFRFTGAYYRDRILAVDSIVGRVLAELEEDGLLERTFVFYFGDHGGVLPGSKGYAYESGLHIPLVVRIPRKFRQLVDVERGTESKGFVSFVDFGPTLLELAGAGMPEGIDGRPFLGKGIPAEEVEKWDLSYGYADRFDEKYDMVRTVRKGKFKYMRSYQAFNPDGLQNNYRYKCLAFEQWRDMHASAALNSTQAAFFEAREPEALYDLDRDPYETVNLAANPDYQDKLGEMRSLLRSWVKGMPDLGFYPEPVLLREAFENPAAFGKAHRADIAALVDIADLSLLPFEEARPGLESALQTQDPIQLYWGLISAACFGSKAAEFGPLARTLCQHENLLVRTRAAEFLGLAGLENPVPILLSALELSEDAAETLLMLNSLVLMIDGPDKFPFGDHPLRLKEEVAADLQVQRRMEYLQSRGG